MQVSPRRKFLSSPARAEPPLHGTKLIVGPKDKSGCTKDETVPDRATRDKVPCGATTRTAWHTIGKRKWLTEPVTSPDLQSGSERGLVLGALASIFRRCHNSAPNEKTLAPRELWKCQRTLLAPRLRRAVDRRPASIGQPRKTYSPELRRRGSPGRRESLEKPRPAVETRRGRSRRRCSRRVIECQMCSWPTRVKSGSRDAMCALHQSPKLPET